MAKGYLAKHYHITETGVKFSIRDENIQKVYNDCAELTKQNIKQFGDRRVMVEGAKYKGVWLETQHMGGEMYATRDMEIALNNHLIFMQYQRRDGRMPGMITFALPWNGMCVHQDWMQGDFFTKSALRMYWFIGEDKEYLKKLYVSLKDFDEYLWNYRDSDGDGCLETWCVWDTGDDNNTRLLSQGIHSKDHGSWCGEEAPTDRGGMPFESAEYMAYSYSHRMALAEISDILENGEGDFWRAEAKKVADKIEEYLWDDEKKAVYDRDKHNEMMYVLSLENLKCMYHGAFSQEMADAFIEKHLADPDEFFTPLPLPNIAANDPCFYVNEELNNFTPEMDAKIRPFMAGDTLDNSWSGPVEGLSLQRSLEALTGYGHHAEASVIGRKWIDNLAKWQRYVQQYNPMTGEPAPGESGYGPTILSALEYMTYLWGVDFVKGELIWSCAQDGADSEYTQKLFGHDYTLKRENGTASLLKDGELLAKSTCGVRLVTDLDGRVKSVVGIETAPVDWTLTVGDAAVCAQILPNQQFKVRDGVLTEEKKVPCTF